MLTVYEHNIGVVEDNAELINSVSNFSGSFIINHI